MTIVLTKPIRRAVQRPAPIQSTPATTRSPSACLAIPSLIALRPPNASQRHHTTERNSPAPAALARPHSVPSAAVQRHGIVDHYERPSKDDGNAWNDRLGER